ncbi:Predicted kinase [Actinacidiphila yanglinensis]|uniref:Predicted kinase n=1 Tax=Actinacidiphila yanglinensis TaxID=310779 RepID=A0A1H6D7M1_9ACTN|nr:RNA ligase family protein [Actinacidiphila yanglinensis]SEG80735.1 Predicted kinase [Actinacidiphila yanglinensis]
MRTHYPRTPHLPWSPGVASDDVRAADLAGLRGREVVVTEKLDGENTTLYADGLHARSLDSAHHPSRTWVKALQGRIGPGIPAGWRVCGENVLARHSLPYEDLESWFYGFSVWDGAGRCLDWDRTVRFLRRLGVPVPPVLWRGTFDERAVRALRLDTSRQEGYVVRTAEGFGPAEFGARVAKWVRPGHVQTGTHWMHAPVVPNGLGPGAALWAVRSGADPEVPALLAALGLEGPGPDGTGGGDGGAADPPSAEAALAVADAAVADAAARLDVLGRTGDARLAGVLAALLHRGRRGPLLPRLAARLGMPQARRIGDLVGLHAGLHRPFPDEERRGGLIRMTAAADLGVLHAVAGAVLAGRTGDEAADARREVEWSALHAEGAGLLGAAPMEPLRAGLREALAGPGAGSADSAEAADRCWAQAREMCARGRIVTVEEALAATWRWRSGDFPRLVQLVGVSGSGKSTFAAGLPGVDARVSLDDLRLARGSRADQSANAEILREGLDRLDAALARGGSVVWDATSLTRQQRSLVQAAARRRDALVTHAVVLTGEEELARRNSGRPHPVPPDVLAAQVRRFDPPYPGQAHRTWYVGASGAVEDAAGTLAATPDEEDR